jgi:hypothetical protein
MKSEGSLPCSHEPATGPYSEPDASSSHRPTYFRNIHSKIISFPSTLDIPRGLLSSGFPTTILYAFLIHTHTHTMRAICPAQLIILAF